MSKTKTLSKKSSYSKRDLKAYYYIAPWILGFAILQLYPFISSLFYSFTDYSIGSDPVFVGLANYGEGMIKTGFLQAFFITLFITVASVVLIVLLTSMTAWYLVRVTIVFALMTVPGKIILALAVAIFLNRDIKGINLIRTLYYIPSLFGGSVAIAILWRLMFLDNGPINAVLNAMGLPTVQFLGSTTWALPTICLLEIWQFGSSMVMFLAALKNVPKSLYEAAEIDGAKKIDRFWHITLPQISPIIFFTVLNQTIQALQNFTSADVITEGGPLKSTYVLGMKLYREGFGYFKMGYASAISWIVFIVILTFTLVLFASSKLWVHYADE